MKHSGLTLKEKHAQDFIPSLMSAGIGLIGYQFILGNSIFDPVPFISTQLPAGVVVGGGILASELITSGLQDHVLNLLQKQSLVDRESALIKPVLSGLTTYGLFRFGVSSDTNFLPSFGLGAGSSLASNYLYDNVLSKKKF